MAYLDFSLYAILEDWIKKSKIKKVSQALTILREKGEDIPREKIQFPTSQYEASEGLTKEELCKKIYLSSSKINQWASLLKLSPEEYLYQLTGWKKPSKERRYFPNSNKDSEGSLNSSD